ncbi:MAG TPA: hypothetical protein VFP87_08690 [Chitinophagaceae bacterium]|nr:hypothetical protein [Chitinophagaceae bacterium]
MKRISMVSALLVGFMSCFSQEVLHLQNGSTLLVQNGVELTIQGGLGLNDASSLVNNGTVRLQNNSIANSSDWVDNSIAGALSGVGIVIFNSNHNHNFTGSTNFYIVQINTAGLNLNNNFTVSNTLDLINGKINTNTSYVFLKNNVTASLQGDASNTGYSNSWINGNFRRLIASNTGAYDFPVGSSARCNLLQFLNNNISGTNDLTASFGPKPGNDAGLNVSENGSVYTAVNSGGVWYLVPDVEPSSGNYALQLYLNGFSGLADNQFGILRRSDASSNAADWKVPLNSALEPYNGLGRKVSDGFARRINISDFSQLGIGTLSTIPCNNCSVVCTYTQGMYSNSNGKTCYSTNGVSSTITATQLMLNAFGTSASQVFGNIANRRFFTLYKTDISNGNIFKMLPGSGVSQALGVDNISPYDGAYYSDQSTWYLVPIPKTGSQKGKINNQLLAQTVVLWFNLRTSNSLAAVDLTNDTLLTTAQTKCGSGIPMGLPSKFGLPHDVIVYLNSASGYTNNVNGLFQLANDVLGGLNASISALDVQYAVSTVNNAFDGCRILTATLPYIEPVTTRAVPVIDELNEAIASRLDVTAFPNPYNSQFSLKINSPVSETAVIEFFTANGEKIFEQKNFIAEKIRNIVPYAGPRHSGVLIYKVTVGTYHASGFVIGIN